MVVVCTHTKDELLRGCYPNNSSRALGATRTTPSLALPCADATQTTGRVHWGRPGLRRRSRCLTFSWTCPTPSRGVSRLPATAPTTATRDVQCCPAHACGAYTSAANTIAVAATACRGLQRAPTAALPTHRRAHRHTRRRTELACQRWPHARRLAVVVGTGTRGCSTTVGSACVRHLCGTHGVDLGPLPVADGGAGASSMAARPRDGGQPVVQPVQRRLQRGLLQRLAGLGRRPWVAFVARGAGLRCSFRRWWCHSTARLWP